LFKNADFYKIMGEMFVGGMDFGRHATVKLTQNFKKSKSGG